MTAILSRRSTFAGAFATFLLPSSAQAATAGAGLGAVVDPAARPLQVYDRGRWCEGPVWSVRHGGLVFSDVRANRMVVLRHDGQAETLRDPSGFANGNAVDREGRLVTCEHLGRRVVRAEPDGTLTVLADRFEGRRLNSPNDLVVARDGAIWFTDPVFGITEPDEGRQAEPEQRGRFVFRLDPDGTLALVADTLEQPNGLAFSPDETVLYVSDTSASLNPEGRREIRAFVVLDGRRLARERLFATVPSGVPDGLEVDVEGRLYAATEAGARIWQPDGTLLGTLATPSPCGNLAFGGAEGRRLYLCNGTAIHAIDLSVRGAAWRA